MTSKRTLNHVFFVWMDCIYLLVRLLGHIRQIQITDLLPQAASRLALLAKTLVCHVVNFA